MARARDGASFHMPSNTRVNLPTFGSALGHAVQLRFHNEVGPACRIRWSASEMMPKRNTNPHQAGEPRCYFSSAEGGCASRATAAPMGGSPHGGLQSDSVCFGACVGKLSLSCAPL
jgi:hypothetical protein